jgi:SNF2 family DNA or RNA helicase
MKPYEYQIIGAEHLRDNNRAYLADDCGLGKTIQAILAAKALKLPVNVLVLCPASAVENWKVELGRWYDEAEWTFMSYSSLIRHAGGLSQRAWDLVVLDEAHYCKNINAKRTKRALFIAAKARRAWLMSATPIPNDVTELYPTLRYLWPQFLVDRQADTLARFRNVFTDWVLGQHGPIVLRNKPNAKHIVSSIPFMRRRLQDVNLQLPPLRVDQHFLPADANLGWQLQQDAALQTGVDEEGNAYTSTVRRLLGMYKSPHIARLVSSELKTKQYEKIVILAHHLDVIDDIRLHLDAEGIGYVGFDGRHSGKTRQNAIRMFDKKVAPVFLAQQSAAGIAINLQSASEMIMAEPDWSPSVNYQAVKRIHRIGTESPCRVRIFTVKGTLDEPIMNTIAARLATHVTEHTGREGRPTDRDPQPAGGRAPTPARDGGKRTCSTQS